jgi:hypothetical protein
MLSGLPGAERLTSAVKFWHVESAQAAWRPPSRSRTGQESSSYADALDIGCQETDLVFTSGYGTPYEPRNFNRQLAARCCKAGSGTSGSMTPGACASLLVALDVHPRSR